MRVDEIEKMEFGEIQSRLDEVVALVESASNKRELAAGYLAIARLHHGSGRLEEAWLAYREAAQHYAECGVEDKVKECEVVSKDLGKRACPPFQDEWDVEVAFDRVARALMAKAKKWCGETMEEDSYEQRPLIPEREVFRERLRNTISSEVQGPRPCVLARLLKLEPEDVEVVLLLHRVETDSRWDRSLKSLGSEEFLPALSVKLVSRFLSGNGRVEWDWARRFQKDSILVRWGILELVNNMGEVSETGQAGFVRLGIVASLFLGKAPQDAFLSCANVKDIKVEPLEAMEGRHRHLITRWLRDAAMDGFLLLSSGAATKEPLEDLVACAKDKRFLRIDFAVSEKIRPTGALVQGLLAAKLAGAIPVVVLTKPCATDGREQEEGRALSTDIVSWIKSFAASLELYGEGVVVVAPKEIEGDLCRHVEPLYVCTYGRSSPKRLQAYLDKALRKEGFSRLSAGIRSKILSSENIDEDTIDEIVREIKALCRSGIVDDATLLGVVRSRASAEFMGFAERWNPNVHWEDLVLPEDVLVTLNEIITFARYRERVMVEWGFKEKMPYGRSLSALFHGPPGTGKTLAACVLANELGVEVYRVDLAQVVSKWVGETEKNLARIFEAASRSKALILFDEADSLFGKRTEVRTAVDRYSNLEVNYLLQKLEDFDGVAVLTTNFPENIDPAFKRRIRFKVAFPFPDASLRATMWQTLIPSKVPRSGNFEFSYLGHAFEFSGAQIKNAILRACFRAASEDRGLTQNDLVEAAKVEAKEAGILVRYERG